MYICIFSFMILLKCKYKFHIKQLKFKLFVKLINRIKKLILFSQKDYIFKNKVNCLLSQSKYNMKKISN